MSHHEMNSLHEKLARQDAEIQDLKYKLITYNTDMAIKDELNKQFIELDGWVQEAAIKLKQTDAEQSSVVNGLYEKLKKSERAEILLRGDNHRLTGDNYSLTEQLKALQSDVHRRRAEAETLETCKKNLENELRDAKSQSRRERHELRGVRTQLERCRDAVEMMKNLHAKLEAELEQRQAAEGQLEERCKDLVAEVEGARASLQERESLALEWQDARAELEERCRSVETDAAEGARAAKAELDAAKAELDAAKAELDAAGRRADRLVAELEAARERDRLEWEARIRDVESRLEETRRSAETRDRVNDEAVERLRGERDELSGQVDALRGQVDALRGELDALRSEREATEGEARRETAALADLEREVLALRTEVERAAGDRLCGGGGGGGYGPSGARDETAIAPPPNACAADDWDAGDAAGDEELINTLQQLYRDLEELQNEGRTRRLGDNSLKS